MITVLCSQCTGVFDSLCDINIAIISYKYCIKTFMRFPVICSSFQTFYEKSCGKAITYEPIFADYCHGDEPVLRRSSVFWIKNVPVGLYDLLKKSFISS